MKNRQNKILKIQEKFKIFLKKDFKSQPVNTIKSDLKDILGPLPEINWEINSTFPAAIRARTVDETKEDISDPKTFGVPPPDKAKQGRANLANHPVFYGGFDDRTVMQEIKVEKKTECFVSIWEFQKMPIVTTFLSKVEKLNDFSSLNDRLPMVPPENLSDIYTNSSFKAAMNCRSKLFTIDNYDLTAKIAHNIIYDGNAKSEGILFPSVIDPYRCNTALNPDFVEQHMKCVAVYRKIWSGAFISRVLGRGTNENGTIIWKKTGEWSFPDEIDKKFSGSNSPKNIHPNALKVLSD